MIPVRNGWEELARCLKHISHQADCPPFEVIVVDDGSAQGPPAALLGLAMPCHWCILPQIGMGVSAARNTGIEHARGEIVVFIDSDVVVEPDCLARLYKAVERSPQGMVYQARLDGGCNTVVERMEGLRLRAAQEVLRDPDGGIRYLNTSCCAVRRAYAVSSPDLFDVGAVRGEDTLLLARLCREGRLPVHVPGASARHLPRLRTGRYILKHFLIGYHTARARRALAGASGVLMNQSSRLRMFRLIAQGRRQNLLDVVAAALIPLAYATELAGRVFSRLLGMRPGRCKVLSVEVDCLREREILWRVLAAARRRTGLSLTYLTAWTLVQAECDSRMRGLLNGFDLCYADGMGVVVACWLLTLRRIKKVTANDFFGRLCRGLADQGSTVALVGGAPLVSEEVRRLLESGIPGLRVVVTAHGYLSTPGRGKLRQRLMQVRPDVVFVGMGQPMQEEWVAQTRRDLPETVFFCVGGLFDCVAGRIPTAPALLRKLGLEWLFLACSCKGRWRRYLLGIPLLFYYVARDRLRGIRASLASCRRGLSAS